MEREGELKQMLAVKGGFPEELTCRLRSGPRSQGQLWPEEQFSLKSWPPAIGLLPQSQAVALLCAWIIELCSQVPSFLWHQ